MTPELYKRTTRTPAFYDPFRWLDDVFSPPTLSHSACEFRTDISDEGDHFLLEADLPGFKREDIHLELQGNTLTLRAERRLRHEQEDSERRYVRSERCYGSYKRVYDVTGIAEEGIRSKYEDGVLTVTLPKKEASSPKAIQLPIE